MLLRVSDEKPFAYSAVILDTTALYADLTLDGVHFRTLFTGARQFGFTLVAPHVVLKEAERHFVRLRDDALARARSALRDLRRVVGDDETPELAFDVESSEFTYAHEGAWPVTLTVLPYPEAKHEEVVARELAGRRPFTEGRGYRDTIIWLSIIEYLRASRAARPVAFITANYKDFMQAGELHPDLARDLRAIPGDARVDVYTTVEQFNDKNVVPRFKTEEQVGVDLERGRSGSSGVDMHGWLREHLASELPVDLHDDVLYAGTEEPSTAIDQRVERIDRVKVTECLRFEPNVYLVRVTVRAALAIKAKRDQHRWGSAHLDRPIVSITRYPSTPVEAQMELLVDVATKKVVRGVVTSFEGDYGKVEEMPGVEFVIADDAATQLNRSVPDGPDSPPSGG
jgi:hypothetical protein